MSATVEVYPHNQTSMEATNFSLTEDPDLSLPALQDALLSWKPHLWDITKVTILLLAMVISLIGNSFVISVSRMIFHQSAVLRTLLISMAITDLLLALSVPLHVLVIILPRFLKVAPVCITLNGSVSFYVTLTLGHFILLAIDRVVALKHPLRFHRFFKPWHAVSLLFLAWMYASFSSGVLLLWQLEGHPGRPCQPELYLGRIYRLLHLSEYAGGAFTMLVILFTVYIFCCEKRRTAKVQLYARRRRRSADFSLRRNKLFTETLLTMGSLFLAMCGPYFGIHLIHFFTKRTIFTSAIENISILIIICHSFVNSFVLPWKIRSYRYRCLYCVCPCVENKIEEKAESEDERDNVQQVSIRDFDIGESNTDSLYKTAEKIDSIEKARMISNGYIPNITITDCDSQKRITLHPNGKVDDKQVEPRPDPPDPDPVWSTLTSSKLPLTDDEDNVGSTARLYFLNPVDNDFLDIPREDDV